MTKEEIVKEVAGATGVDRKEVAAIVESLMDSVKKSVAAGEPVYLRGFGTFSLKHRAAKPARKASAPAPKKDSFADIPSSSDKTAFVYEDDDDSFIPRRKK